MYNFDTIILRLNQLLRRFDFTGIVISEEIRTHNSDLAEELTNRISTGETTNSFSKKYLHVINNNDEITELWEKGARYFYTYSELMELGLADEERFDEWPRLFHTLENSYHTITIIGKNEYASAVYNYFKANKCGLTVNYLDVNSLTRENDTYILHHQRGDDEVVLLLDLFANHSVVDVNGDFVLSVNIKSYYRQRLKTIATKADIDYFIIPKLVSAGVKVIKVYVPILSDLKCRKLLGCTFRIWTCLSKMNGNLSRTLRAFIEGTTDLISEEKSLVNDNSRGYSVLHGNGENINFSNGFRITVGNDYRRERKLFIFGPCFVRGLSRRDAETIASDIQNRIIEDCFDYNVLNYGSDFEALSYIMRSLEYREGVFCNP